MPALALVAAIVALTTAQNTVGAGTDVSELRQVFGTTAHAAIPTTAHLAGVIGPLFRSALQSADLRRRKSQGLKS